MVKSTIVIWYQTMGLSYHESLWDQHLLSRIITNASIQIIWAWKRLADNCIFKQIFHACPIRGWLGNCPRNKFKSGGMLAQLLFLKCVPIPLPLRGGPWKPDEIWLLQTSENFLIDFNSRFWVRKYITPFKLGISPEKYLYYELVFEENYTFKIKLVNLLKSIFEKVLDFFFKKRIKNVILVGFQNDLPLI